MDRIPGEEIGEQPRLIRNTMRVPCDAWSGHRTGHSDVPSEVGTKHATRQPSHHLKLHEVLCALVRTTA